MSSFYNHRPPEQKEKITLTEGVVDAIGVEVKKLLSDNEFLKEQLLMHRKQLIIILLNNGGTMRDMHYPDLSTIDFSKISIGFGMSSCSIVDQNMITIKTIDDLPLINKTKQK